jgi:hypothetical protein
LANGNFFGELTNFGDLLSDSEILAVGFVNFYFYNFLCNVGCFFDFGVKFAKFSRKSIFFKSRISPEARIGKFRNWMEMKANYTTNKENTQVGFFDNFHNIKNFVQVDHFENISKNLVIFFFSPLQKNCRWSEKFCNHQK